MINDAAVGRIYSRMSLSVSKECLILPAIIHPKPKMPMRKTFTIFVMLVCCIMAHAQTGERIFTYDAAGDVVPNAKFIDRQELWNDGAAKEAWDGAYPLDNGSQLGYVTVRYLDVHVTALVFAGWSYAGDVPWIMIVILNKDKATVVFNRRGVIQECTTDNYYGLNLTYADQYQELDDDGNRYPADSELKKFRIWQEGQYLRFAQTQREMASRPVGGGRLY